MNIARCHLTVLGLLFTSRLTSVLAFFLKTHQFPLQNNKYWHQEYDQAESLPDQKHSPRPTDPSLLFITKVPKTGSITIRSILLKFCATRRPNIGCWFPGLSSSTNRSRQHTFYEQARLTVPDPKPFNIFFLLNRKRSCARSERRLQGIPLFMAKKSTWSISRPWMGAPTPCSSGWWGSRLTGSSQSGSTQEGEGEMEFE